MSADCFGLEVSDDEVRRWNTLAASGEPNFVTPWNRDHLRPIAGNALPAIQKAFLLAPLSEEDLSVPLLMEFGCGVGFHAPMALSQASAYVGIDISSLAVAMARYHFGNVEQARFLHSVFDRDAILDLRGTVGGIYGINFFYHQPAERLRAMIATAGELLGGRRLAAARPAAGVRGHRALDGCARGLARRRRLDGFLRALRADRRGHSGRGLLGRDVQRTFLCRLGVGTEAEALCPLPEATCRAIASVAKKHTKRK